MPLCSPWVTEDDYSDSPCASAQIDETVLAQAMAAASDILYNLTGRQWTGECHDQVRPCSPRSFAWCGCWTVESCTCGSGVSQVMLPNIPVRDIVRVVVDGVVLDEDDYRVDNRQNLVRLGGGHWPCCQDLKVAGDEPGGWLVEYHYGADPPAMARRAALILGCELARAYLGDDKCKLPKRVTTITRQGVSMAILDPLTLFPEGLTGLAEIDLWLSSLRLGAKRQRARVLVPGRIATWRRP